MTRVVDAIIAIALLIGAVVAAIFIKRKSPSKIEEHEKVQELIKKHEAKKVETATHEHKEEAKKIEKEREAISDAGLSDLADLVNETFDD